MNLDAALLMQRLFWPFQPILSRSTWLAVETAESAFGLVAAANSGALGDVRAAVWIDISIPQLQQIILLRCSHRPPLPFVAQA